MLTGNLENAGKEKSQGNIQKKPIKKMLRYPVQTKSSQLSQEQKDRLSEKAESKIILETSLVADQTPRFVTCINHDIYNGNLKEYSWDQEKIFVHECLQDDLLMLQNVFEGKIISPLVYPLIFKHKSLQKEITLRSLPFYRQVENDPSIYQNLSTDEKSYFLIGLRDLFIAGCRNLLSQGEKETLRKMVDLVDPNDENIVYKTISNIDIAPYPTASHKMVRFIDEKADGENPILDECFVRNELGLLIGFVDPRELSFHNFENIINLDSLFKKKDHFSISNFQQHGDEEVYTFDLADNNNTLLSLDRYGLYTTPVNKLSRGGERFIFASQLLGKNITRALKNYIPHENLINSQFRFVNYVFRYNKFKPGDRKFTSHYDTPYHDPACRHYSKYTLLLYLTPGTVDPVLSIDNCKLKISTIENNGLIKGVIFDQKYEHEGKSFIDSDKIFLRTELIYKYDSSAVPESNNEISRKFNIACYMTKQSMFIPELEKYASDCFNQVAQARLDLSKANLTQDILIYKKYKGISFITNGYDYWFLKPVSLKDASIVAILDYFNCKYETNESFNKLTFDEVINVDINDICQVFKWLKHYSSLSDKDKSGGLKKGKASEEIEEEECKSEELAESLQCNLGKQDSEEEEEESEDQKSSQKGDEIIEIMSQDQGDESGSDRKSDKDDDNAIEEKPELEEKFKKDETNKKSESEKESEEGENEEDDEAQDEDEDEDDEYCRCDRKRDEIRGPSSKELKEYIDLHNRQTRNSLRAMKKKLTIFLFNKEIKIEKSKIKVTEDSIIFGDKIPGINFAALTLYCSAHDIDYDGCHSVHDINVKGYGNIPPIHYKTFKDGYHLKIELFNNGFVRNISKELTVYSPLDDY